MGFPEKPQVVDGGLESEGKKWVIAGISIRPPLKPIRTNSLEKEWDRDGDSEECSTTTPTAEEARIPTKLPCPPAPKKQKATSRCSYNNVKEFFTPPDLETVFIRNA
ncbi:hypothetical protein L1049_005996 [Liquidambar formosana]|uniref:Cyclin-dependent protein kinase inhibitor SMR6 n=1 Tax=Liquidambar formosana TaxID=63359 RepID=A0AAP0RGM2_LIQFO